MRRSASGPGRVRSCEGCLTPADVSIWVGPELPGPRPRAPVRVRSPDPDPQLEGPHVLPRLGGRPLRTHRLAVRCPCGEHLRRAVARPHLAPPVLADYFAPRDRFVS